MTTREYLAALLPDTYRVLGISLQPFSLGHAFLLERLQSPFLIGGREPLPGDLRRDITICTLSYPKAVKWVNARRAKWTMQLRWLTSERFQKGCWQFLDYLQKFHTHPQCWSHAGEGRQLGTPFLQAVKITGMMHLGLSELESLCRPLSLAVWDYTAVWELKDKLQMINETEKQAMEFAKELHKTRN